MPILAQETDIYPENLFEVAGQETDPAVYWWALYTLPRREKELMRRLLALEVPFYCPIIPKRNRSPAGRVRTSYVPLFHNYVFIHADEMQRYRAVSTGCVSKQIHVVDGAELTNDLRQIHRLIQTGAPLTLEARMQAGEHVRVRSGPFRDYEGTVLRREGERRLLVAVNFLQQGASILLDDFQVEII